jgi:hypothetical protein
MKNRANQRLEEMKILDNEAGKRNKSVSEEFDIPET